MRASSPELTAHLAQDTTSLCFLWRLQKRDASQSLGFTNHDVDIAYDDGDGALIYKSQEPHDASAIQGTVGGNVDTLEAKAYFTSDDLTDADLQQGLWDDAEAILYLVNWRDLSMGHMILFRGFIGEVASEGVDYGAELRSLSSRLNRRQGRTYQVECDAELGDSRCQFAFTGAFTHAGTVTSVSGSKPRSDFADSSISAAAGFFTWGKVVWATGDNAGREHFVRTHYGSGNVALLKTLPRPIQVGDTFTIYAGCDKQFSTCKAKFNNHVNLPGVSACPWPRQVDELWRRWLIAERS